MERIRVSCFAHLLDDGSWAVEIRLEGLRDQEETKRVAVWTQHQVLEPILEAMTREEGMPWDTVAPDLH